MANGGIFDIFGSLYQLATSEIKYRVADEVGNVTEKVSDSLKGFQVKFMASLISSLLFMISAIFLMIAIIDFMIDILNLPRTLSFFIAFLVFMIAGFIVKKGGGNG